MLSLASKTSIRERLFGGDPFQDAVPDPARVDMQGWGETHEVFAEAVEAVRPKVIVELGVWKGLTCIRLANECAERGITPEIIAVDTWLGSTEHWLDHQHPHHFPSLRVEQGFPTLYHTFLANIFDAGVADRITPLPNSTDNAAVILSKLGVKIDLLHVDAAHETEPVLRDLRLWFPLMRKGGWLIGDDYKWKPVRKAAETFSAEKKLELHSERNKYWFKI